MKTLTTYEKICLGCAVVLAVVLLFYLGKAAYKWSVKEPPQIGSSVQAYPAKVVTEWEKQVEPIGDKKVAEVIVDHDDCNCIGDTKLFTTTYNGEILYKVYQCLWSASTINYPEKTHYEWREVVKPTNDKEKAMKEHNNRKREYEKNEAIKKREEEISKLKWKVVK